MRVKTWKIAATDTAGARVRASEVYTAGDGRNFVVVAWDYDLMDEEMHAFAARQLVPGATRAVRVPDGDYARGYVFDVG